MIITCEECNSSFSVNDSLIKDTGSKVRCSKCDSVFVAFPISTEDELSLDFEGEMLGKDDELGTGYKGSVTASNFRSGLMEPSHTGFPEEWRKAYWVQWNRGAWTAEPEEHCV